MFLLSLILMCKEQQRTSKETDQTLVEERGRRVSDWS